MNIVSSNIGTSEKKRKAIDHCIKLMNLLSMSHMSIA